MTLALITMHDDRYRDLAAITLDQNKRPYCDLWGYELHVKTQDFTQGRGMYFDKYRYMLEIMTSNADIDWVWWLDCDAMITNWATPMTAWTSTDKHLVITADRYNINNGSFFLRNSIQGQEYLGHMLMLEPDYLNSQWPEQQPMIDTIDQYADIMEIWPQRNFNSYDYDYYHQDHGNTHDWDIFGHNGNWQPGDFVCHWPGIRPAERIGLATLMLEKVIK